MTSPEWNAWVDTATLKVLSHHASGIVASLVFFALVAQLLVWTVRDANTLRILEIMEDVSLIAQFGWLMHQTGVVLWRGRVTGHAGLLALVA